MGQKGDGEKDIYCAGEWMVGENYGEDRRLGEEDTEVDGGGGGG